MDCSTPSLPVHHQLLEFTQTHVLCVSDAIQPYHPLLSLLLLPSLFPSIMLVLYPARCRRQESRACVFIDYWFKNRGRLPENIESWTPCPAFKPFYSAPQGKTHRWTWCQGSGPYIHLVSRVLTASQPTSSFPFKWPGFRYWPPLPSTCI